MSKRVKIQNPYQDGSEYTSQNRAARYIGRGLAEVVSVAPNGKPLEIRFTKQAYRWFYNSRRDITGSEVRHPLQSSVATTPGRKVGNSDRLKIPLKASIGVNTGPTPEETHWRESVLLRDGYKCVFCQGDENLEADHIRPKFLYPDLKYDVNNGRTLCNPCHKQTATYGSKVRRLVAVDVEE